MSEVVISFVIMLGLARAPIANPTARDRSDRG